MTNQLTAWLDTRMTTNHPKPNEVLVTSVEELTDGELLQLRRFLGRGPRITIGNDETPDREPLPERSESTDSRCTVCGAQIFWTGRRWAGLYRETDGDVCPDVEAGCVNPDHTPTGR